MTMLVSSSIGAGLFLIAAIGANVSRTRRRRSAQRENPVSGLPNFEALRSQAAFGSATVVAATGIFWSIPTGFFRGSAKAAAVFTLINLTGNLSGLIIPPVIGTLRVMTDGFGAALVLLASLLFLAALLVRVVGAPAR